MTCPLVIPHGETRSPYNMPLFSSPFPNPVPAGSRNVETFNKVDGLAIRNAPIFGRFEFQQRMFQIICKKKIRFSLS